MVPRVTVLLPEVEMRSPDSESSPAAGGRREPIKQRLTEASVRALPSPEKGEVIVWDEKMPGLALRIGRVRRAWF